MDETSIRLSIFITLLVLLTLGQQFFPRRKPQYSTPKRWLTNFSIVIIDSLLVRGLLGLVLPVLVAQWSMEQQLGLFNQIEFSGFLTVILCVVLLDGLIYWQHRLFHNIPMLWRLHRVHHYDKDYDLSTALRFHPVEILLSVLIKNLAIIILGAPVLAVLIFESLLNGMALFNHANLKLPLKLDNILRRFIVTPDMHRVHHSIYNHEMHRNFGFNLSIWDRWFNSYVAQPKDSHEQMMIGQPESQQLPTNNLFWLMWPALKQPIQHKNEN